MHQWKQKPLPVNVQAGSLSRKNIQTRNTSRLHCRQHAPVETNTKGQSCSVLCHIHGNKGFWIQTCVKHICSQLKMKNVTALYKWMSWWNFMLKIANPNRDVLDIMPQPIWSRLTRTCKTVSSTGSIACIQTGNQDKCEFECIGWSNLEPSITESLSCWYDHSLIEYVTLASVAFDKSLAEVITTILGLESRETLRIN